MLRGDCTQWLGEVETLMPSVVVAARAPSGEDAFGVRVLVDGAMLADKLAGVAIEVDPGPHVLHFELPGAQPVDKQVVIREGEKARRIEVAFTSAAPGAVAVPAPSASTPAAPVDEQSPAPDQPGRPTPALVYVLGGVGLVALAGGIYLDTSGLSKRSNLDRCKPNCNPDDVNSAKTSILAGDVATGAGVLAFAGAALLYLTRPSLSPALVGAIRLDLAPAQGNRGAVAGLKGSF